MTLDEQIKILENNAEFERKDGDLQGCLNFRQLAEWLKDYKRLLEQEPCEDAISKQKAIEAIDALYLDGDSCVSFRASADGDALIGKYQAITALDDLPPVTPQPKMGRWKRINKEKYVQHAMSYYRCSECGKDIIGTHNYCPNCGAKMSEVDE